MSSSKGNDADHVEETFNNYYLPRNYGLYPSGRMSPSSWDDSDQDLTESHSSYSGDLDEQKTENHSQYTWKQDRRQTLARIRRRSRECDSPVDSCNGSQNFSDSHKTIEKNAVIETRTHRNTLRLGQDWSEWDLDDIILDIERELKDKRPGILGPQSASVSKINNYCDDDENRKIRCNLNVTLSRILEVSEPRQNASIRCSQMDQTDPVQNIVKHSEDNTNKTSLEINETLPNVVKEENIFLAENVPAIDEYHSDDRPNGVKSKTKKNTFEQAMSYSDSEYVNDKLKFIFDDTAASQDKTERATIIGNDDYGLNLGVSLNDTARFEEKLSDRFHVGDKINVEKYNSYCIENTQRTLEIDGNVSERMVHYVQSIESMGLDNLFKQSVFTAEQYANTEQFHDNRDSLTAPDDEQFYLHEQFPRSGRETFLKKTCSPRKELNFNNNKPNMNYLEDGDKIQLLSSANEKDDSSDEYFYTDRCQITSTDETPQSWEKSRKSYQGSSGRESNDHLDTSFRNEKRNSSRNSSATFRNKIILELDLSDNDDKCSTVERKMFADSTPNIKSSSSMKSTRRKEPNLSNCLLTAAEGCEKRSGRSGIKRSFSAENEHPFCEETLRDSLGIGDNKWTSDKIPENNLDFPQERGDADPKNRFSKEWRNLLIQFDDDDKIAKKPLQTVFWVDLEDNVMDCKKHEYKKMSSNTALRPEKETEGETLNKSCTFNKSRELKTSNACSQCFASRIPRVKARKRKRTAAFHESQVAMDATVVNDHLINLCHRKDVPTHGRRSFHSFLMIRKRKFSRSHRRHFSTQIPSPNFSRNSTVGFSCFQALFKLFVNIFKFSPSKG